MTSNILKIYFAYLTMFLTSFEAMADILKCGHNFPIKIVHLDEERVFSDGFIQTDIKEGSRVEVVRNRKRLATIKLYPISFADQELKKSFLKVEFQNDSDRFSLRLKDMERREWFVECRISWRPVTWDR